MGATSAVPRAGEEVRLLFFRCAGERFALEVAYVSEILPVQELTPVPFVPPTVAGIINHRGTIFTLISFARLAGLGEDGPGAGIVILRLPKMAVGITVGEVEGIARLPTRFFAAPAGAAIAEVPFLHRANDQYGRLVHAVDAEGLIDTIYQLSDPQRIGERAG